MNCGPWTLFGRNNLAKIVIAFSNSVLACSIMVIRTLFPVNLCNQVSKQYLQRAICCTSHSLFHYFISLIRYFPRIRMSGVQTFGRQTFWAKDHWATDDWEKDDWATF